MSFGGSAGGRTFTLTPMCFSIASSPRTEDTSLYMVMHVPLFPALPVRPDRWMYDSSSRGGSICTTKGTWSAACNCQHIYIIRNTQLLQRKSTPRGCRALWQPRLWPLALGRGPCGNPRASFRESIELCPHAAPVRTSSQLNTQLNASSSLTCGAYHGPRECACHVAGGHCTEHTKNDPLNGILNIST